MMCQVVIYWYAIVGAFVTGAIIGWLGGFVHGSYWRPK
jgi:hypothetical protein